MLAEVLRDWHEGPQSHMSAKPLQSVQGSGVQKPNVLKHDGSLKKQDSIKEPFMLKTPDERRRDYTDRPNVKAEKAPFPLERMPEPSFKDGVAHHKKQLAQLDGEHHTFYRKGENGPVVRLQKTNSGKLKEWVHSDPASPRGQAQKLAANLGLGGHARAKSYSNSRGWESDSIPTPKEAERFDKMMGRDPDPAKEPRKPMAKPRKD